MAGYGDLVLAFNYPAKAGRGAVKKTLNIPLVTDVERSVNVNLTELPTIIYGCRSNFCMDLGATEKITFKCERVNPFPYNDLSLDPDEWSNGKWYRHLEDLFDRWQNFGLDGNGEKTGGCTMRFTPADSTLVAPIEGNVFLIGSLNMSYSVQRLSFSLPLQLASMKVTGGAVSKVTLTLKTNTTSQGTLSTTYEVLQGFPVTVPLPDEWTDVKEGNVFMGWEYSGGYIPDGSVHTYTSAMTLTARWRGPLDAVFITSSQDYTIPSGVDYIKVYAIGGGGGAGGMSHTTINDGVAGDRFIMWPGGAGGSGEVQTGSASVSQNSVLSITIGEGGKAGTNMGPASKRSGTNGGQGKATVVLRDGNSFVRAEGGAGGFGTVLNSGTGGAPGTSYCSGGSAEEDGQTTSPNIEGNVGKAGKASTTYTTGSYPRLYRGGGGGGAAAFYYRFDTEAGMRPESGYYESRGGAGSTVEGSDRQVPAGNGYYGGGGGSGDRGDSLLDPDNQGNGGGGAALVLLFKVNE